MKVCFHTNGHLGDFIITIPFLNLLMEKYPDFVYIHNENMKPWGKHGKKLDYTFVEFRYKLKEAYNSSKNINHEFF